MCWPACKQARSEHARGQPHGRQCVPLQGSVSAALGATCQRAALSSFQCVRVSLDVQTARLSALCLERSMS